MKQVNNTFKKSGLLVRRDYLLHHYISYVCSKRFRTKESGLGHIKDMLWGTNVLQSEVP